MLTKKSLNFEFFPSNIGYKSPFDFFHDNDLYSSQELLNVSIFFSSRTLNSFIIQGILRKLWYENKHIRRIQGMKIYSLEKRKMKIRA